MQFYKYFLKLCEQKGVSPTKACEEMGLSSSAQSRWRKTESKPNGITIMKFSTYFGIPYDDVENYENIEVPAPSGRTFPDDVTPLEMGLFENMRKIPVVDQEKLDVFLKTMYPEYLK